PLTMAEIARAITPTTRKIFQLSRTTPRNRSKPKPSSSRTAVRLRITRCSVSGNGRSFLMYGAQFTYVLLYHDEKQGQQEGRYGAEHHDQPSDRIALLVSRIGMVHHEFVRQIALHVGLCLFELSAQHAQPLVLTVQPVLQGKVWTTVLRQHLEPFIEFLDRP